MAVGLADQDKIFYARGALPGLPILYVGSRTGRDGIHGATMASAEFTEGEEDNRPTVQVGDPFTEKLLIEACLELMATDAIQSIQDMGAAGLTSSSVEMADKGGVGIEMDLDAVPQRETGMTAYEIMLSESQERMLMILKPGKEAVAKAIFDKWDLDAEVIGITTTTGRLVLKQHGAVVCDIPVAPLGEDAPNYDRPWTEPARRAPFDITKYPEPDNYGAVLLKLMSTPDMASKRWVWEQYDRHVMGDTLDSSQSGGDAAIVRVHGTNKALAICSDCNPHYVAADPYEGGKQVVAEAYRNLSAVGALPIAITDNLNFGNPEKPATMGYIVKSIEGMAEACRVLDFPVVSGNVSLYNETDGKAIPPTPVVGGVGLIEDLSKPATLKGAQDGDALILVGEAPGHLGASLYARVWLGLKGDDLGPPPPVDLETEKKNGSFIRSLINAGLVNAVHDVSDGGIACAAAEMALASGIGVRFIGNREPDDKRDEACLFGEASALYLVAVNEVQLKQWDSRGFMPGRLGVFGGDAVVLETGWGKDAPEFTVRLSDLRAAHEGWMPGYMNAVG
jgi:phosphoribosylformylglycinamidine synthase